jgi:hypothetical protein
LLPVIPAITVEDRSNALTINGELSTGTGIADLYTGMDGGSRLPLLPNPNMASPAIVYPQNIDPGLITFDREWKVKTINWRAFVVGLQYCLPVGGGKVWLAGNYSRIWSDNIKKLTPAASWGAIFTKMDYVDVTLGAEVTPSLYMGVSYQTVKQSGASTSAGLSAAESFSRRRARVLPALFGVHHESAVGRSLVFITSYHTTAGTFEQHVPRAHPLSSAHVAHARQV